MAVEIYNFSELFSLLFIFILSIIFLFKFSKFFNVTNKEAFFLYIWHTIFAIFFLFVDLNHGHDANGWYSRGHLEKIGYSGNEFMYFFTGILKFFKIKYLAQNFIFNFLGTIGLIVFYSTGKELCKFKNNKNFFPIILILILLPGLSFWTSGITKDTFSIFALFIMFVVFLCSVFVFWHLKRHKLL